MNVRGAHFGIGETTVDTIKSPTPLCCSLDTTISGLEVDLDPVDILVLGV
jgi:hypothetical protein